MSFPFYAISLDDFETKPKKIIGHYDKAKNLVAYRIHSCGGKKILNSYEKIVKLKRDLRVKYIF